MTLGTSPITKQSSSLEVRNAVLAVFQKMPDGSERTAVEELFTRFNDYITLRGGSVPAPETGTSHENHIAKIKATTEFFETMGQTLSSLGLIANWNVPTREMSKVVYEHVREDRAKYRRAIKLIAEMYTVHIGGNGALFSIDALPDEIRLGVIQQLKSRRLLHEE